jgi:hypothetical protein
VAVLVDHQGPFLNGEPSSLLVRNKRIGDMGCGGNLSQVTVVPSCTGAPRTRQTNPTNPVSNRSDSEATMSSPRPETNETAVAAQMETATSPDVEFTPCQLISRLAENPHADITQVPVLSARTDPGQGTAHDGDVECGKAYEMLIKYATSEEKMDYIARALEGGCRSTGKGGCAVKKAVIWDALDTMCG